MRQPRTRQQAFDDAFEKLRQSLLPGDAHDFASVELQDVWNAVRKIEEEQRKRRCSQNLRRIEPFLRGIEKYAKVIEVLSNGTPYMPFIWAPVKLMLQYASQYRDIFEALITAYAEIGAALPRFDRYSKAFEQSPEFQSVLASVYSDILEFHRRAYKFFKRKAWHILFLSLWRDFQSRFTGILNSLKQQRDFVDREATSLDIAEAKASRQRVQDEIERMEQEAKEARLRHAVAWIAVDDTSQDTQLQSRSQRKHHGTCEWFLGTPQYRAWLADDTVDPLLWLKGIPGAGKSVICAHTLETIHKIPGVTPLWYFCNNGDKGPEVCNQILRTITLQLLSAEPDPDLASLISNNYASRGFTSKAAQLRALIPEMLEIVPCARLIIDGLDECSQENQKVVLRELQNLCLREGSHCKILFSSCAEVHIGRKLRGKPCVSLNEKKIEVERDIRLYVKDSLAELKSRLEEELHDRFKQEALDEVELILVEKAKGMFLWVRLVVDELQGCHSIRELRELAQKLPEGLEKAYGRILDRITSETTAHERMKATRILEWMACSFRILKSYEIQDAIYFRPGYTILDSESKLSKGILDLCRPLIEEGPSQAVDFVHFSAKEYILKQEYRDSKSFLDLTEAHCNVTFSCISYLNTSVSLIQQHSSNEERAISVALGIHGLHLYANKFWIYHLLEFLATKSIPDYVISPEWETQLIQLLRFGKNDVPDLEDPDVNSTAMSDRLFALNHLPEVQRLILRTWAFRQAQEMNNLTNHGLYGKEVGILESDPTYFSLARHYYQITLEALLSSDASHKFPHITSNLLQDFNEIYGDSAFVCRYYYCHRHTNGFALSRERDKHEAAHERKYRCDVSTCFSFATGFTTKSLLNKHNEKYHDKVATRTSLSAMVHDKASGKNSSSASTPKVDVQYLPLPPSRTAIERMFDNYRLGHQQLKQPGQLIQNQNTANDQMGVVASLYNISPSYPSYSPSDNHYFSVNDITGTETHPERSTGNKTNRLNQSVLQDLLRPVIAPLNSSKGMRYHGMRLVPREPQNKKSLRLEPDEQNLFEPPISPLNLSESLSEKPMQTPSRPSTPAPDHPKQITDSVDRILCGGFPEEGQLSTEKFFPG